ncbi:MAG: tRNA (adenine-N1)-methyltransferase [Euryarchaeota archaeon]|nr:tRNA (adenine-N1)-methyltransferase [Euryarchaeota archaeon]
MRLLIDERGRKFLVDEGVEEFHTDLGVVRLGSAEPPAEVQSHLGHRFVLLEPSVVDLHEKLPRAGSVVVKKEVGLIVANTGIGSGSRVVEAGTGTGSLAIYLAHIVGDSGRVYTYELNEKHLSIARRNFAAAGVEHRIVAELRDVREGIEVEQVDAVVFDMPDPWLAVEHAFAALKRGGFIAVYNPYIEQIRKAYEAMRSSGFRFLRVVELLEREIEVKSVGTRPRTRMVGHTGYLAFGRKC